MDSDSNPNKTYKAGFTIIVPVFNSENSLDELVSKINSTMNAISSTYEVILVNDGSRDRSWESIVRLSNLNHKVVGINLARNFGQHAALLCGVRYAKYDKIVTLDDDLQNPPEEIKKLVGALTQEIDLVYGDPEVIKQSHIRAFGSIAIKWLLKVALGQEFGQKITSFRLFRTRLRESFSQVNSPGVLLDAQLSWATQKLTSVKVRHEERKYGASNYNIFTLSVHAISTISNYSVIPLKIASFLGIAFTIIGILIFIFVVGRYFVLGQSVPGFPFLASIISLFSGIQLFTLGVIGEYLSRMYLRLIGKPIYSVKEIL